MESLIWEGMQQVLGRDRCERNTKDLGLGRGVRFWVVWTGHRLDRKTFLTLRICWIMNMNMDMDMDTDTGMGSSGIPSRARQVG